MRHPEDEPRIFKADSDAATAWVIDLVLEADGRFRVKSSLRELGRNIRPDPIVAERVATWLESHQRAFCKADSKPPGCLGDVLATAKTRLVASEEKIRNAETSVGNWVADVMLEAFAGCRADASIINAGGLRMNQDLAAGTPITRRHVEELMQYRTDLYLLELTGEQLQAVITHAISEPGAGRWLQVSGLAFVYDADTRTVVRLVVRPAAGGSPVDVSRPGQKFRVVVNKFLIEDKEEGYDVILGAAPAVQCTASAPDLKILVYGALAAKKEIAPAMEGRICKASETTTTRCQAETWLKGGAR
jgi:2',3'-cyclic-nucleotide 2'-phosphodiesterase (5'-nucleotidase family)